MLNPYIKARNLSNALKKRAFLRALCHLAGLACAIISVLICRHFTRVKKNKIVFTTFSGAYDCNPKYICEEILRRGLPYEIVWVTGGESANVESDASEFPHGVTLTKVYSYEFYKHLYSAHIIIDNNATIVSACYLPKRSQRAINTWHGSLGIKRFPKKEGFVGLLEKTASFQMGKTFDIAISNSAFEDGYYRETYFKKTTIKRLGHARNDLFFNNSPKFKEKIQSKVHSALAIPFGKKICLYGPTFRDNGSLLPYDLPYDKLLHALSKRFGGEWVILTRFHPRTKKMIEGLSFPEGVVSASAYPDIAELMYCADAGITDYSSWICEYIHTRRPGFLFATDIASYDSERGFYDPLDKMPFPLAKNSDELIGMILAFDEQEFLTDIDSFLKKKECIDDGHASERIVDLIAGLI